ncbi:hypothetical protein WN943_001663 [Citrus x changshan-huyou]
MGLQTRGGFCHLFLLFLLATHFGDYELYMLPDNTSASKLSSEIPNGETPATKVSTDYDGAEEYRAERIAISNSESPATLG